MESGLIHPLTLKFRSPELEAEYWQRHLPVMRIRTMLAVALVLIIYTIFGFLDPWIIPAAVTQVWAIRAFNFLLCVCLILLTRTGLFARSHQLIILSLPVLSGTGILMMIALAGEIGSLLYYAGVILAIVWIMLVSDLRFPLALTTCFFLLAGYEIIVLYIRPTPLPVIVNNTFFLMGTLIMTAPAGYSIKRASRVTFSQSLQIEKERQRSEALLLNILPREIAEELKERQGTIAERYDEASILFADIVGFTQLSVSMAPEEMVRLLNEVFSFFDTLVDTYGVEKIRTIGDNYMVASGVPRRRKDHADVLARMALQMRDYVCTGDTAARGLIQFRIGINSGPVIAGVIGSRKFQYDVWGDTVNTASRMESHGVPGQIQISSTTHELLKNDFICHSRGRIQIKSKGEMETWLLTGERNRSPSPSQRT